MNRLLFLLATLTLLLGACGSDEPKPKESDPAESVETEKAEDKPSQDEINAQLKEDAVEYSFVEINSGEIKKGEKIKLTGEVSLIITDNVVDAFTLTTTEGDGFGMYNIMNPLSIDVTVNDNVTIYGTYSGTDATGMPEIVSTIIDLN